MGAQAERSIVALRLQQGPDMDDVMHPGMDYCTFARGMSSQSVV